jgi:D-amino-acid oxidase
MRIIVVGGGVVGMTSAVRCAEAGHEVEVWAAAFSPGTTSDVAGAIWWPYHVASDRAEQWGERTYLHLSEASREAKSGVRVVEGVEIHRTERMKWPAWARFARGFRDLQATELPPQCAGGFTYSVPVIDTTAYLAYLASRLEASGGTRRVRRVRSLEEALAEADAVIHCAGLGARELAGDPSVHAVRGEILRVEPAGADRFVLDDQDPAGITYLLPRGREWVLGGTSEEGEESLAPNAEIARAILARCAHWCPALKDAKVISHLVGLRPARPTVRLELEKTARGAIVHNYGHGGAGVTLAWGCAENVVDLLR